MGQGAFWSPIPASSGHLSVPPPPYSTDLAEAAQGLRHWPLLEHGEMGCGNGRPQGCCPQGLCVLIFTRPLHGPQLYWWVRGPLCAGYASHGGERGAGLATALQQGHLAPTVKEGEGHTPLLRFRLLAFQLLLILVQEEGAVRGHRSQWLEDVWHGAEAVLGGRLRGLRQKALLGADGAELEVLSVHGDVRRQGLQVQLVKVSLEDRAGAKQFSSGRCLRDTVSSQPLAPPPPARGIPPARPDSAKLWRAQDRKTQMCPQSVEGLLTSATSLPVSPSTQSFFHTPHCLLWWAQWLLGATGSSALLSLYLRVTVAQCSLWDLRSENKDSDGPSGSQYGHHREFSQADAAKQTFQPSLGGGSLLTVTTTWNG